MSMRSSRTARATIPVWLIVVGMIGLLGYPMASATTAFLLIAAIVTPMIVFKLWKNTTPAAAEVPVNRIP